MNTSTKPSLQELLPQVDCWVRSLDGYTASLDGVRKIDQLTYTIDEFDKIDDRLAFILDDVHKAVPGTSLVFALDYWNHPERVLPLNDDGDILDPVQYFKNFEHADEGLVFVTYTRYLLTTIKSGRITYPTTSTIAVIDVPTTWLDNHYPKWKERSLIAASLSLEPPEFTRFLLDTSEVPSLAIPTNLDL